MPGPCLKIQFNAITTTGRGRGWRRRDFAMTTLARPVGGTSITPHESHEFAAITRDKNSGRSSQVLFTQETAIATLWSLAPAILGGAIAAIALRHSYLPILLLAAHQLAVLFLSSRKERAGTAWRPTEWMMILLGTAATVAVLAPHLVGWLAIPVAPAILLRAAQSEHPLPKATGLLRMFSIAALGAVLVQLGSAPLSTGEVIALLGATLFFLFGLERLTISNVP